MMKSRATLKSTVASMAIVLWLAGITLANDSIEKLPDADPLAVLQVWSDTNAELHVSFQDNTDDRTEEYTEDDDLKAAALTERLIDEYHEEKWVDAYLDLKMSMGDRTLESWNRTIESLSRNPSEVLEGVETSHLAHISPELPSLPVDCTPVHPHLSKTKQGRSEFTISRYTLNFGIVPVNEAKNLTFTIANNGTQTLTGSITSSSPSHRVVSGDSFMLTPGSRQTVTLRFHPTIPGIHLANVAVSSSNGTVSVILKGTATRTS